MKILSVDCILLSAPGNGDPYMQSRSMRSAAFILIKTDTEHSGIGETYAGYFAPELVPEIVAFYAPILEGANPMDIDILLQRIFICGKFWARVGLGSIVISGIEAALLDLKGKALGVPAYELLGGRCHTSLPCYATGGPTPTAKDDLIAKIEHYRKLGFRAVKMGAGSWNHQDDFRVASSGPEAADYELQKFEIMKREFGDEIALAIDGHMDNLPEHCPIWNESTAATVLKALENCNILFFEEPLPYTDVKAYASLRTRSTVPVAGGECLTSLEEWRDWLDNDPFDLPQLDASFMGGPTVFVKIARLCELKGLSIATHAWSAAPGVAANLHAAFACRNTKLLEWPPYNSPLHTDLWIDPPTLKDGNLILSDTPGLGIHLPSDFVEKHPFQPGTGEINSVKGKVQMT